MTKNYNKNKRAKRSKTDEYLSYLASGKAQAEELEDFLGYPVDSEVMGDLKYYVREASNQMPKEELAAFASAYKNKKSA